MSVITEIDSIIFLLEAQIPANPQSPANQRKRRSLERELNKYFGKLEKAFPYSKVSAIYGRYVKEE